MEISLALSGGAARGAFHLGVLDSLERFDVKIRAISGASIGAFVACAYASELKPKEILEIIKTKEFKKMFSLNLSFQSFFKIDESSEILDKFLKFKNLEDLPLPTIISAVDLKTSEVVYFEKGEILSIVFGSCAIVPVFGAVKYGEYILVDGCFVDNLPTKPLVKFKHPIVAVDLQPVTSFEKLGLLSSTKRALKIALTPSVNKISKNAIYISDERLDKFSLFSFKGFDEMFKLGQDAVDESVIKKIETKSLKG